MKLGLEFGFGLGLGVGLGLSQARKFVSNNLLSKTCILFQKEMRRVLNELSEEVCEDLESCLEMRAKGVIGKKPSSIILSTLSGMRNGMMTASKLLGCLPRQRA